jgi:hypothetical protein
MLNNISPNITDYAMKMNEVGKITDGMVEGLMGELNWRRKEQEEVKRKMEEKERNGLRENGRML